EVRRALAVENGVASDAIVLEKRSTNTHENVVYSSQIATAKGWRRILLVSSPYHMRRAVLTWRHAAPQIDIRATPVEQSQFYAHERGASFEQMRGVVWEYAALLVYRLKGWL